MTLWFVCLGALALGAWWDVRTGQIPAALPLALLAGAFWCLPGAVGNLVSVTGWAAAAVVTLWLARVGVGDVALAVPLAVVLGPWIVPALVLSLLTGCVVLHTRQRLGDPFVPHLLGGFLGASALRGWLGA